MYQYGLLAFLCLQIGCARAQSCDVIFKQGELAYELNRVGQGKNNVVQAHTFSGNYIYTQHVTGKPEFGVINQFTLLNNKHSGNLNAQSASQISSLIGHQGLATQTLKNGDTLLWTSANSNLAEYGTKVVRIRYNSNGDMTEVNIYQLFDIQNYRIKGSTTPTISTDGKWLIVRGYLKQGKQSRSEIRLFPLSYFTDDGDYSPFYVKRFLLDDVVSRDKNYPLQSIASDGKHIFVYAGFYQPDVKKKLYCYSLQGELLAVNDDVQVGKEMALSDGKGQHYEPEGLAFEKINGINTLTMGVASGDKGARKYRIWRLK